MKSKLQKIVGFAAFAFFVLGCSAINKIQKEVEKSQPPQILNATDGSCQVSIPSTWRSETSLNEQAILQASNRIGEQYIVIIRESKQDFGKNANLDFLTNLIQENLKEAVTSPVFSPTTAATVNGFPSRQFEVGGEVLNYKIKYLYSVTETPQNFYQIITWTLASRFDSNRPQLLEVINSFKEISANPQTPFSSGNSSSKKP